MLVTYTAGVKGAPCPHTFRASEHMPVGETVWLTPSFLSVGIWGLEQRYGFISRLDTAEVRIAELEDVKRAYMSEIKSMNG